VFLGAPTATRTRDLPLRRSPIAVETYLANPYSQLTLPADIASGAQYVTSASVPPYAGECRFVRGFSVGAAAGIPGLWGICGENGVSLRVIDEGAVPVPVGPGPPLGTMSAVADDILELRQAFDDAELRGDAHRIDALLANDFLPIGEQSYQLGKREWIDRHRDFRYLSLETTELDVRHYGTTAIVRCAQRSRVLARPGDCAGRPAKSGLDSGTGRMAARRHPLQHPRHRLNHRLDPGTPAGTMQRSQGPYPEAADRRFWSVGDRIRSAGVHAQMTWFWAAVGMQAQLESPSL
jgi:hypothetical protein